MSKERDRFYKQLIGTSGRELLKNKSISSTRNYIMISGIIFLLEFLVSSPRPSDIKEKYKNKYRQLRNSLVHGGPSTINMFTALPPNHQSEDDYEYTGLICHNSELDKDFNLDKVYQELYDEFENFM